MLFRSKGSQKQTDESSLGLSLRQLTGDERSKLNLPQGEGLMIVDVDPDKGAAEADLRSGDIILKANQVPVDSIGALSKIVREVGSKRGALLLQLQRNGDTFYRSVPVTK